MRKGPTSSTLVDPRVVGFMHKKKVLSEYGQSIMRHRVKSSEIAKSFEFKGLLLGVFDPDVRPFEWPERDDPKLDVPDTIQPMLFEEPLTWD